MSTITRITPTSNQISVKYHWFRQHVGKELLIWKIKSKNQKADIFTKGLQSEIFVRIRKITMRLVRLQMRGSLAKITSSLIFGDIMV